MEGAGFDDAVDELFSQFRLVEVVWDVFGRNVEELFDFVVGLTHFA